MGGLPDSDPDRRGRRSGLRWPGSEGENISEMVLGGEVGPDSTTGEIVDTAKLSGISFTELGISSAIDGLGTLLGGLKLLKLGREDVGDANGLVIIKEHDTTVDG